MLANLTRPHSLEVPLTCTERAQDVSAAGASAARRRRSSTCFWSCARTRPTTPCSAICAGANGDAVADAVRRATSRPTCTRSRALRQPRQLLLARRAVDAGPRVDHRRHRQRLRRENLAHRPGARATRPLGAFSALGKHARSPGARRRSSTIWHHLDSAGVAYHNYGEIANTGGAKTTLDVDYPGVFFNTRHPRRREDRLRDRQPARQDASRSSRSPTSRCRTITPSAPPPGAPTPQSMVADNDEATGRFVDALSHSRYWESSIVFIIEDDPSGRRRPRRAAPLAVSWWSRRGSSAATSRACTTTSRRSGTPSTLLLGVGPINLYDAQRAGDVRVCSPTKPDFAPYTFIPRKVAEATNPPTRRSPRSRRRSTSRAPTRRRSAAFCGRR